MKTSGFTLPLGPYAPETRYHEGIPSLAASPSGGRLWATWYASATGCEVADNYLILSTSADGGATWREVLVYDPDPGGPVRAFDPELWVSPDGVLRWIWTERTCPPAADPSDKYAGCHCDPSNDRLMMADLDPEAVPDAGAIAGTRSVRQIARGVMMCKPTVLSDGTWLLPVAHWKEAPSACVVASTDGGRTFAERGGATLPEKERTFDEHQIVELADGRLRLYIRAATGPNALWESESADGGWTWTEPRPSALPHTSSRFFVRRLASGNLVLVKNGLPGEPGTGRRDMTAYLSEDDGATWPWALPLDTGREKVSYPDGQQLPDGRIAVVYDHDRTGARQILFAVFREEDIRNGHMEKQIFELKNTVACTEVTPVPGHEPSLLPSGRKFSLVWHDEFDGTELDRSKWDYRLSMMQKRHPAWTDKAVRLDGNSNAVFDIRIEDGRPVSSQLQTGYNFMDEPYSETLCNGSDHIQWPIGKLHEPLFERAYGYWECRCRLQQMPGWWSAFWIQSPTIGASLDPARTGVEIDVMECFKPGVCHIHNLFQGGYGKDNLRLTAGADLELPDPAAFHRFGVLWDDTGYTFYVDGREHGRIDGHVSRVPEFVLVSTEVKGYRHADHQPVKEAYEAARAGDTFLVDYVRVFGEAH